MRADVAAKSALSSSITNMKFPGRELTSCMSKFCLDEWQDIWNCCENNKLHSVYHTVGSVTDSDCVVISRLQIGHSCLTHSYLLSDDDVPLCETCGVWATTDSKTHLGGMSQPSRYS